MSPVRGLAARCALLAVLVTAPPPGPAGAADTPFGQEGWYTWRVESVPGGGDGCCWHWNSGRARPAQCNLDDPRGSWGNLSPHDAGGRPDPGQAQLYARWEGEQITELRTLGPDCEVRTDTPWTDLGDVDAATSLRWLTEAPMDRETREDERSQAIASHAGPQGRDALVRLAKSADNRKEREDAIFWMGQLRVEETRHELLALMETGETRSIREQAIFAYAQSPAEDRLEVLIDVIEDRDRDLHDRKQALFWLAQSDDGAGVDYIHQLLLK